MIAATGRFGGFTLLELLVVLAIVGLLAAAVPLTLDRALPKQRLRIDAQDLALELRALREESVARQSVMESVKGGVVIQFFPDGTTSGGEITLSAGAHTQLVKVSALTGRIAVQP